MVLLPVIFVILVNFISEGKGDENCCERKQLHQQVATWQTSWSVYPTASSEEATGWSVQARVPMTAGKQKVLLSAYKFFVASSNWFNTN